MHISFTEWGFAVKGKKFRDKYSTARTFTALSGLHQSPHDMSSAAAAAAAEAPNDKPPVQICKGINGLEKVVLRDVRGSSVEVLPLRYFIVLLRLRLRRLRTVSSMCF